MELEMRCLTDSPYGGLITDALRAYFPMPTMQTKVSTLEALQQCFVGTGQTRFGPAPNPESLVRIREILRFHIDNSSPIPVLVPWGSKKPNNAYGIDVAELGGLKTLLCLKRRISEYYTPGIIVNLRIEDVGGYYLFRDEGDAARNSSSRYVGAMTSLISALELDFINPVKESDLVLEKVYCEMSDKLSPMFEQYIMDSDDAQTDRWDSLESWKSLLGEGWHGSIPKEQRDFYRNRYASLYGADVRLQTKKLSEYFAGSLARYKLGATGADKSWGKQFLQVNFAPPAPGSPMNIISNRLNYRTLPACYTRDHLPPWRAHGYLRVKNDNEITPALASFKDERVFESFIMRISGTSSVDIGADYIIE